MIRFLMTSAISTLKDRKGVTAAEYAVLAAGIVIAVGGAATAFGPTLTAAFTGLKLTGP
ncbi:Flp family type IVb pilin [Belnapia rosea]|uniref:Flp/Fap pilin component n=1 Tax=Belnapia rosea TaxID=938405 RepID=A0A1G7CEF8_9PROT|nr:Flp family type IVb pilin [Belnapia rosea]SDE37643.1 Flp/Fap pilin component [Belnapia rosea]